MNRRSVLSFLGLSTITAALSCATSVSPTDAHGFAVDQKLPSNYVEPKILGFYILEPDRPPMSERALSYYRRYRDGSRNPSLISHVQCRVIFEYQVSSWAIIFGKSLSPTDERWLDICEREIRRQARRGEPALSNMYLDQFTSGRYLSKSMIGRKFDKPLAVTRR